MEPKKMRVKVPTKLNVRVEPSWTGKVVDYLDNKTIIEVSDRINTTDGVWYRLEAMYLPISNCEGEHYPRRIFLGGLYKIEVRRERWVYGRYLRPVWFTKKFKLYG